MPLGNELAKAELVNEGIASEYMKIMGIESVTERMLAIHNLGGDNDMVRDRSQTDTGYVARGRSDTERRRSGSQHLFYDDLANIKRRLVMATVEEYGVGIVVGWSSTGSLYVLFRTRNVKTIPRRTATNEEQSSYLFDPVGAKEDRWVLVTMQSLSMQEWNDGRYTKRDDGVADRPPEDRFNLGYNKWESCWDTVLEMRKTRKVGKPGTLTRMSTIIRFENNFNESLLGKNDFIEDPDNDEEPVPSQEATGSSRKQQETTGSSRKPKSSFGSSMTPQRSPREQQEEARNNIPRKKQLVS
jgi:hypothetical protein